MFSEELSYQGPVVGLGQESGRLARGAGPSYYQTNVIAGSSGGFGAGLTLLDPSGNPVFETAADGWVRIPLYRAPATVLPAGMYSVRATGIGSTVSIPLQIK